MANCDTCKFYEPVSDDFIRRAGLNGGWCEWRPPINVREWGRNSERIPDPTKETCSAHQVIGEE